MKRLIIALLLSIVFAVGCASTSTQPMEKVKMTGVELEQWLSSY